MVGFMFQLLFWGTVILATSPLWMMIGAGVYVVISLLRGRR